MSGGFYDSAHDQLVLYEPMGDDTLETTRAATYHEAFHQFARRALPPLPVWLDEGLAESFAVEAARKGRPGPWASDLLLVLEEPFAPAAWREFIERPRDVFYDLANGGKGKHRSYARAWAAALVLREGDGALAKKLSSLVSELGRASPAEAQAKVLDDATLAALEEQVRSRVRELVGR